MRAAKAANPEVILGEKSSTKNQIYESLWRAHFVVYLKYYNIKHKQRIEHKNRFVAIHKRRRITRT